MTTPTPANRYQLQTTPPTAWTVELWNQIFGSIADRLNAREALEASFELLQSQGVQAALDYIQVTIAPHLSSLQDEITAAQLAIDQIINEGTAPNSDKLGGQLPEFYATAAALSEGLASLQTAIDGVVGDAGDDSNTLGKLATQIATKADQAETTQALAAKASQADVNAALAQKLSLTGGTLTGHLAIGGPDPYVRTDTDDKYLVLSGGSGWTSTGATIALRGAQAAHNPHGLEIFTGDAESFKIDNTGAIFTPGNPLLVAARDTGWETWAAHTHYGIAGSFHVQRGGFYTGSVINGSGTAIHVPKTGYYWVANPVYMGSTHNWGRLDVIRNGNGSDIILHSMDYKTAGETSIFNATIRYLLAGDYVSFYNNSSGLNAYHSNIHTRLIMAFLG